MLGRRILAAAAAAAMLLPCFAALGESEYFPEDEEFPEETEETAEEAYVYTGPEYDPDHLVVGNPTKVSGSFTTQLWGYNTADVDVSGLINGYNLVLWDYAYEHYMADPLVTDQVAVLESAQHAETEEGSRTYLITLNEQLKYSDGTPITARDYAFCILLNTCPEARALGGDTDNYDAIVGAQAYQRGEAQTISGVRILNDHTLSLTIRKESRPFFYEMGLLRCFPMPAFVIAPGCTVEDEGQGAFIRGDFTSELLAKTVLDPETGYLSHPAVVSGAYRVLSYDAKSGVVEFEINDEYLGNYEGIRPSIRRITLKPARNEDMMEKLASGEFGLLNKTLKEDTVLQGMDLIRSHNYSMSSYARIGQTFLSFNCEKPIPGRQKVRQAIACCLDKDETVQRYAGRFGMRADGYYGLAQWMYRLYAGTLELPAAEDGDPSAEAKAEEDQAALEALRTEELPVYPFSTEEAVRLLEEDGWTLNAEGRPYVPGRGEARFRNEDGKMVPLQLKMVYPEGNRMAEILRTTFLPNLTAAGIMVHMEPMDWEQLLRQFYRQEPRDCDIMYLGSNFFEVFDPEPTFRPEDAEIGKTNYTGIADPDLYERARDLSMTEPGNILEYEQKWIAFQRQYIETLPAIPVYMDVYVDFYTRWLQNYTIGDDITWSNAIIRARMSDPEIPTPEEEAGFETEEELLR